MREERAHGAHAGTWAARVCVCNEEHARVQQLQQVARGARTEPEMICSCRCVLRRPSGGAVEVSATRRVCFSFSCGSAREQMDKAASRLARCQRRAAAG
jgi:hypothetical protein